MKKERFLKRLFSVALGFLMLFASVVLVACKESGKEENAERKIYLLATNFFGTKYRIEQGETLFLEYDRPAEAHYWWSTVRAYYCDTNEEYTEEKPTQTLDEGYVDVLTPGTYRFTQTYFEKKAWFQVVLVVNENRPLPDFEFIPGYGCIDFVKNEKYVYKYDGKQHLPNVKLIYQGEVIHEADGYANYFDVLMYDGEKFSKCPAGIQYAQDVGLYQMTFMEGRSYLPDEYYDTFRKIEKTILVEIVN